MTALTGAKDISKYGVEAKPSQIPVALPVKGATTVHKGALVGQSGGYVLPARSTSSNADVILGVAAESVDNSAGSDGDLTIKHIVRGVFAFVNSSSTEAITNAEVGKTVYAADDQTVSKTSASSTRVAAGVCVGLDGAQVLVQVG